MNIHVIRFHSNELHIVTEIVGRSSIPADRKGPRPVLASDRRFFPAACAG